MGVERKAQEMYFMAKWGAPSADGKCTQCRWWEHPSTLMRLSLRTLQTMRGKTHQKEITDQKSFFLYMKLFSVKFLTEFFLTRKNFQFEFSDLNWKSSMTGHLVSMYSVSISHRHEKEQKRKCFSFRSLAIGRFPNEEKTVAIGQPGN